jgi:hypothetical protein
VALPTRRQVLIGAGASAAVAAAGAGAWWWWPKKSIELPGPPPKGWEAFAGAHFGPEPRSPYLTKPSVRLIRLPDFDGAFAIWGAVGRDPAGQIWVSAAAHFVETQSGRLFVYNPDTDEVTPCGDVLSELRRLGLYRAGEQQPKIHTKFFPGEDGCLYFASTDDPLPGETLLKPPKWGSHLWRLRNRTWEHLHARPEGVLAMAGNGKLMYCLAYPDHLLMQYECQTGKLRTVAVGSVEGHCSRNLFCDFRGHVYVPRLKMVRPDHAEHTLVQFDTELREVVEHPLPYYQYGAAGDCHGIIAYQPLPDGSIVFNTHAGRLFRLDPAQGRSRLSELGWFHPSGRSYASSLFAFSGERYLVGAAQLAKGWVWVCFDMKEATSYELPLELPTPEGWSSSDAFLYGCTTRDNTGDLYLVGGFRKEMGKRVPVVLRVRVPEL